MTAGSGSASEILMAAHCLATAQFHLSRFPIWSGRRGFMKGGSVKRVCLSVHFEAV